MDSRRKDFKKGVNSDDGRRRREANVIAVRKDKKEESMAKRRNLLVNNFTGGTDSQEQPTIDQDVAPKTADSSSSGIATLMADMQSTDMELKVRGVRGFRRLLSVESNPPVQDCIDCGAIPMFVDFLQLESTDLQFEAAWALTNIASTDRTRLIMECGAVPFLVALLRSANPEIREQCAWCLGNVAGDGPQLRDFVLSNPHALPALVDNINQPQNISLLRNCVWSLSNFCRGKPQPPLEVMLPAMPVLGTVVNMCNDQEAVVDAAWALSYLSDGDNHRIQAVVDTGVIPKLIAMLQSNQVQCIVPALRCLGNIVSGSDSQTEAVVQANVLPCLVSLLSHTKKSIRKETCWMLSNIAAGNKEQLSQLMSTPSLMQAVISQAQPSSEWDVRKEAAWIICNIASGGSKDHISELIRNGAVGPLCQLMEIGDVRILVVVLEAVDSILKSKGSFNGISYIEMFEENEGIEKLEFLQEHENNDIYKKAMTILETFFGANDIEDDIENMAPAVSSNQYSFGITNTTGKAASDFGNNFFAQQPAPFSAFTVDI